MESLCLRLKDRVAVVTGGASGIGRATVLRLLDEGARVVLADINPATTTATMEAIGQSGRSDRVRSYLGDVSSEVDNRRMIEFAVKEFGRLDCLVNNAGLGGAVGPLVDVRVEDWDRTQTMVLRSVFLGIRHAARKMIAQGTGGTIINISSTAGVRGGWAGAAYSAAKAAILNLTRSAAVELSPHRIRCNSVLPGCIMTPLSCRGHAIDECAESARKYQAWPEAGMPEHIAAVVAFLASDDSRFIVGQEIAADGGQLAYRGSEHLFGGTHAGGSLISRIMKEDGVGQFDWGTTRRALPERGTPPAPPETLGPAAASPAYAGARTIVLTGASRGLGLALAERLIDMGHTVLGCARSEKAVAELRDRFGPPHRFDVVDVGDDDQVRRWAETALADHEAPDLLLNNAAIIGAENKQIWRHSPENFQSVMRVNVAGVVHVLRHFVPPMLKRMRGVIVNFSSGWGREVAPKIGPYGVSKWAIEGLNRILAAEMPKKMAAVSLHPGIIHTETMALSFGEDANKYPTPEQWAKVAAPFLLDIRPEDNGEALSIPGMTEFRGMRTPRATRRAAQAQKADHQAGSGSPGPGKE